MLDVSRDSREVSDFIFALSIDHDGTSLLKVLRDLTTRKEVEQGGLTSTGGTDDGKELTWHDCSRYASNDFLWLLESVLGLATALGRDRLDLNVLPSDLHWVLALRDRLGWLSFFNLLHRVSLVNWHARITSVTGSYSANYLFSQGSIKSCDEIASTNKFIL